MIAQQLHISTEDTFFIDAPVVDNCKCPICTKIGSHELGWIGVRCSECKLVFDPFEITMPDIVKMRRELLGLTRKQMGEKTGYKKSSIKRYEFILCTHPYFDKTTELIKKLK